jgi:hypothetical protein
MFTSTLNQAQPDFLFNRSPFFPRRKQRAAFADRPL